MEDRIFYLPASNLITFLYFFVYKIFTKFLVHFVLCLFRAVLDMKSAEVHTHTHVFSNNNPEIEKEKRIQKEGSSFQKLGKKFFPILSKNQNENKRTWILKNMDFSEPDKYENKRSGEEKKMEKVNKKSDDSQKNRFERMVSYLCLFIRLECVHGSMADSETFVRRTIVRMKVQIPCSDQCSFIFLFEGDDHYYLLLSRHFLWKQFPLPLCIFLNCSSPQESSQKSSNSILFNSFTIIFLPLSREKLLNRFFALLELFFVPWSVLCIKNTICCERTSETRSVIFKIFFQLENLLKIHHHLIKRIILI